MNILFITKELPYPINDGCRNRTFNILKGLSRRHNIALVCFGDPEKDSDRIDGLKGLYESLRLISEDAYNIGKKGFIGALLGLFSLTPFVVKSRFSVSMKSAVAEIMKKNKIDMIFCDSIYQAVHIPDSDMTRVLSEHNIESDILYRYFKVEKNLFKKAYIFIEFLKMKNYELITWRKFNKCIVVSDIDRVAIEKKIKGKDIQVVPNGVDTDYFYPSQKKEKPNSMAYTGLMSWFPNNDAMEYFLNRIYPLIKQKKSAASLTIVGKNPSDAIKRFSSIDNSINVTGVVKDVRPHVSVSQVFIVPLRVGSGTRLKILEAMAMGKVVVSTRIGCEGLDVKHKENILLADNEEAFADYVVDVFNDEELRKNIGCAARALVEEKYSWNKIMEKL